MNKSIVYANLTSAGLGNKMYVWIKAFLFAHKNNLKLYRSSWIDFHPKAYLRNFKGIQRDFRFYGGIFKKEPLISILELYYYKNKYVKIYEPTEIKSHNNEIFIFHQVPTNPYFLHPYINERELIKNFVFSKLKQRIINKFEKLDTPLISIHLRRGDLLNISNELVTPIEDVIKIIKFFKDRYNTNLPIFIYTDSPTSQIKNILKIPNVYYKSTYNPMLDLLHISKSKIIIPSIISSFSTWACFFSSAIILRHPNDTVKIPLNPNFNKETFFNSHFQIKDNDILISLDRIIEDYLKSKC